eukprot:m.353740 g.353740  ORF g.353740 m.353740 type:complete len:53 (-) comp16830_c0_seq1:449-607(-)
MLLVLTRLVRLVQVTSYNLYKCTSLTCAPTKEPTKATSLVRSHMMYLVVAFL